MQDFTPGQQCPHRPPCDACPRFGASGIARPARAALQELAREYGLPDVPIQEGALFGFRHRARLAIRGRLGAPKIGLFEADSHRVVHIPNCRVHHPLINEVAAVVRGALVDARVTCYSDRAHLGLARYLQVVIERSSQTAQVVLVANSNTVAPLTECLELIRTRLGPRLHSLWLNFNVESHNVILGAGFYQHCGPQSVIESFGGASIHYPPGAFGQSNLEVAQQIVDHIRERVPRGSRVAEFHAGVGAIGLSLLDRDERLAHLRVNEVSPQSLFGLQLGLADLMPALRDRVEVLAGPAAAAAEAGFAGEWVIVDPPRKGLDAPLAQTLATRPPEQLIYVSCAMTSFLHDLRLLLAGGKLRLTELTAFNLMPFTEHVETVARFERT
jgi:23S rRNA (uracil1939-C5)-methyltransferase